MGRFDKLDAVVKGLSSDLPNGLAVRALNGAGEVLYEGSTNQDLTLETVGRVFSASKLIAPILVLQAVEKGLFALDDPVTNFTPDSWNLDKVITGFKEDGSPKPLEPAKTPLTWRQLCDHTGGVPYFYYGPTLLKYFGAELIGPAEATFYKKHFVGPLTYQPGTDFAYGVGLGTAGLLLEVVTGKNLDAQLQESVCKPLGLTKTRFDWREEDAKPEIYGRRETPGDFDSPWKMGTVTAKADACFGDSTLVTCGREYSTIMGEVLKATQGKPNKLFTRAETGKQLLEHRFVPQAQKSATEFIKANWSNRGEWVSQLDADAFTFGLGYAINHVDLPTGRKAGSGSWEGYTGPGAVVNPEEDYVLSWAYFVIDVLDPGSRHAQDKLETAFLADLRAT